MLKSKTNSKKPLAAKKSASKKPEVKKNTPFPVVAIGSSAGGLEAASILFKNLATNTGMAFIYVQHLSPDHKSLLTPILSKITKMKVQEIDNMEHMLPNNVYVIPNNRGIKVTNGHIKLIPRSKRGAAISIDILFSSLALTHKENVVGIILSGNGKDGTEGLEAIKKAGGLTFAQDKSAQASSMPDSAIASGAVDFVLSPKVIADELTQLGKTGLINHKLKYKLPLHTTQESIKDNDAGLKAILNTLHKEVNVDFSLYKMATVKRRIKHRMMQCDTSTVKEYAKLVSGKKKEVELLYKDLLINITDFFRDEDTFKYLKSTFLPELLKGKNSGNTLRIWIPACSTGEEAYTMAILINELQATKTHKVPVQIFATDLSDQAISDARIGEYSEDDLKPVGKKRIERFFIKSGKQYRIVKEIRDMCVFATHNILRDPPFSRIDFISCRNLLIYFDTEAQKKALATMSFALNDGGFLLLGKSETVGIASSLFSTMSNKYKIYQRKISHEARRIPELTQRFTEKVSPEKINPHFSKKNTMVVFSDLEQAIDATMLSIYMPASVVINKNMDIIKFRGDTSLYLSHQSGQASLNVLKMIRPEFIFELRNAIQEVIKTNIPVIKTGIELNPHMHESLLQVVTLEVRPLAIEWGEPLYMVVFRLQEADKLTDGHTTKKSAAITNSRINKQIEELHKASAEMITVIESQDKAYEELQAANEEIISASEEFQTLNEELETSKEEIEATNEELLTTNQELQMRNEQLAESYNFSEAVAETMHEPMIILDKHLRIKSANKAFYQKFRVMERGTKGMLLYELGDHQWDILSLRQLLENINQKNTHFYDHEITHTFPEIGKKTMLLNARRIVQKTQNDQLILLTFTDTTELIKKRKNDTKDLEDIIQERTKALDKSYKTVIEKNAYLEKINKELETFTFISSHDLQEPLRKIRMFTSVILEDEKMHLSEEGKKNLKRIQTTGNRMQQLINDLLLYASIKDGEKMFKKADLNEIVVEVIDEFKEVLQENHGTIEHEELCSATIIGFQFRQLIYNLISNSLKFSHPKRFPRITIKSKTTPGKLLNYEDLLPEVNYCHICFTDNGIGFDPQYKDRIFDVFQRLHPQEKYKGTGIGLAICKRIVENHKGIIIATGKLNKGAQFDIYIPTSRMNTEI